MELAFPLKPRLGLFEGAARGGDGGFVLPLGPVRREPSSIAARSRRNARSSVSFFSCSAAVSARRLIRSSRKPERS